MTRLFTCGFEENDFTKTMWNSVGTTTIVTTAPHSGTYHSRTAASFTGPIAVLSNTPTSGTFYTRFYFNLSTVSSTDTMLFRVTSQGGTAAFNLTFVGATAVIKLTNSITTTNVSTVGTFTAATWYRAEVRHLVSDTVGQIEARFYVGDSSIQTETSLTITGEDTLPTNVNQFQFMQLVGTSGVMYLDDICINDSNGSFQNSWAGMGKTFLIAPNSDVSVQWTKAGSAPAGTNFGGVAEVPGTPDDGTTYNEDSGTSNVDRLGMTALGAEVPSDAVITLVDVYARVSAGATSQTLILRLWDNGGASTDGPTVSLGNGTWASTTTSQHLVFNAATYTKANINSFNVGYKGASGVSAKRVTSVWTNVEWTPAAGGPLMGPFNQTDWPNPAPKPPYLENRSWIGLLSYYGLDQFFGDTGQPPSYEMFNPGLGPPRPNLGFVNSSFVGLQQVIPPGHTWIDLPPKGYPPLNVGFVGQSPLVLLTFVFPRPFYYLGQGGDPNPRGPVPNVALGTWINPTPIILPPAGVGGANWIPTWMPRRGR